MLKGWDSGDLPVPSSQLRFRPLGIGSLALYPSYRSVKRCLADVVWVASNGDESKGDDFQWEAWDLPPLIQDASQSPPQKRLYTYFLVGNPNLNLHLFICDWNPGG